MKTDELLISATTTDHALIDKCRELLDQWSSSVPFSPIHKLGSETEFVEAKSHAVYHTKVTTQIQKRSLLDHEEPYRRQDVPETPLNKARIDPWQYDFPPNSDFAQHRRSKSVFESRRVYECSTCKASGEVTCGTCSGSGLDDCSDCNGLGSNECSTCDGGGQIARTRTRKEQAECSSCSGSGKFNERLSCHRCHGRGTVFEEVEEEYYVPCTRCSSTGKITCHTCRGRGQVTCSTCDGSGRVTCHRCAGEKRLISFVSVEVEEDPVSGDRQFIAPSLPAFKKKDGPLARLTGSSVFAQDELQKIERLKFADQPAAVVLTNEVESCRTSHSGKILRQRIEIEQCLIVEYRYRYHDQVYAVFVNPAHGLVEDLGGPIQSLISNTFSSAEEAYSAGRFEEAYRLIVRSLCMDEAMESEKNLRDQIVTALRASYLKVAAAVWIGAAAVWLPLTAFISNLQDPWPLALGLLPLGIGHRLFSADLGLTLAGQKQRNTVAVLFALAAFLSGAGLGQASSVLDFSGWLVFTGFSGIALALRESASAVRLKIEDHFKTFPDRVSLQEYVQGFDPTDSRWKRIKIILVLLVVLMSIQPALYLMSLLKDGIHLSATLVVTGDHNVASAPVTLRFKDHVIYEGPVIVDKPTPIDLPVREIGFGELIASSPGFEEVRKNIRLLYGLIDAGEIRLARTSGQVTIYCALPDAEFSAVQYGREVSQGKVSSDPLNLPVGDYVLTVTQGLAEESHGVSIQKDVPAQIQFKLPRGSLAITGYPREGRLV